MKSDAVARAKQGAGYSCGQQSTRRIASSWKGRACLPSKLGLHHLHTCVCGSSRCSMSSARLG